MWSSPARSPSRVGATGSGATCHRTGPSTLLRRRTPCVNSWTSGVSFSPPRKRTTHRCPVRCLTTGYGPSPGAPAGIWTATRPVHRATARPFYRHRRNDRFSPLGRARYPRRSSAQERREPGAEDGARYGSPLRQGPCSAVPTRVTRPAVWPIKVARLARHPSGSLRRPIDHLRLASTASASQPQRTGTTGSSGAVVIATGRPPAEGWGATRPAPRCSG